MATVPRPSLLAELKRRHVLRVVGIYLVAFWLVLQVADVITPALPLPDWTLRVLLAAGVVGLPIVIALAWIYDFSRHGIVRTPDTVAPATVRLVVLPFRSLRGDAETDALGFSLADAIACSLAGIRSLVVRSTMSIAKHAAGVPDLQLIAREANVDVVLTGTLLRRNGDLEIRAQLLRVPEGTLLWAHNAQLPLNALAGCQNDLARGVIESLNLPLDAREQRQLKGSTPASAHAYELYLRANQYSVQSGQWARARALYLECLELDPDFAPAWARLGRCYRLLGKFAPEANQTVNELAKAQQAFERALAIDPDLSLTHSLYAQLEIDLGRAEDAMVRLLARSRVVGLDADILAGLVQACRFCGLLAASVTAYERARELDPHVRTSVAHTYFMQGRYEHALAEYNNADIGYVEALALAMLGRESEAIALLAAREHAQARTLVAPYLASLRALLEHRTEDAHALIEEALSPRSVGRDGEAIFYMARQSARLGDSARALTLLDVAVDGGFFCAPVYAHDPWLETVRDTEAFSAIAIRVHTRHRQAIAAYNETGGELMLGRAQPSQSSSLMPSGSLKPT
ncbi:MAG: tetratricopeptide repeat protein [Gemmatimonadota bacterium]